MEIRDRSSGGQEVGRASVDKGFGRREAVGTSWKKERRDSSLRRVDDTVDRRDILSFPASGPSPRCLGTPSAPAQRAPAALLPFSRSLQPRALPAQAHPGRPEIASYRFRQGSCALATVRGRGCDTGCGRCERWERGRAAVKDSRASSAPRCRLGARLQRRGGGPSPGLVRYTLDDLGRLLLSLPMQEEAHGTLDN